ncbi:hypothetical protein KML24007_04110 [Alistipes indistinctus]|uniref:HK97 family phage prohead protease n=1 Tax=Alistipes indistinctus TaxID=626932 RepID=UPI0036F1FF3D
MEVKRINSGEVEVRCALSDIRIEQRDGESGGRTVTGYAAKFETWSSPIHGWFIEKIRNGAFEGCDMTDTIMCFNHNIDAILARVASQTLTLEIDEVGLRFSFDAPNTSVGNDMIELLSRGDVNKCSFRFSVEQDEWLYADEDNGLKHDQRTIIKISKLYDVALVVYPAYKDTEASVRHLEQRKAEYLESLRADEQPDGNAPDATEGEPPAGDSDQESGPDISDDTPFEEQPDKDDATARSLSRDRLVQSLALKIRKE